MKTNREVNQKLSRIVKLAVVFSVFATSAFAGNTFVDDKESTLNTPPFAETLAVNESRTKTIKANEKYNWTNLKLIQGQTIKFSVSSPAWNNGDRETTAAGYPNTVVDAVLGDLGCERRYSAYNWMALVGGIYSQNSSTSATGATFLEAFLIGMGRTWKVTKTGYLAAFANDCFVAYWDNSRVVTLTIKRIE